MCPENIKKIQHLKAKKYGKKRKFIFWNLVQTTTISREHVLECLNINITCLFRFHFYSNPLN